MLPVQVGWYPGITIVSSRLSKPMNSTLFSFRQLCGNQLQRARVNALAHFSACQTSPDDGPILSVEFLTNVAAIPFRFR